MQLSLQQCPTLCVHGTQTAGQWTCYNVLAVQEEGEYKSKEHGWAFQMAPSSDP